MFMYLVNNTFKIVPDLSTNKITIQSAKFGEISFMHKIRDFNHTSSQKTGLIAAKMLWLISETVLGMY